MSNSNAQRYTLAEIRKALGLAETPTTEELCAEDFKDKRRVHDWRNYASDYKWKRMTDLERLLDYAQAETAANAEEWD